MKTKFRKASKKDAKKIAKILVTAYKIHSIPEGKKAFLGELKKGYLFFVAVQGKELLGLVSFIEKGLPKHGLCELDRIGMLPEARGSGIAKRVFYYGEKEIKALYKKNKSRLRKLYLLTHANNLRAQKFYKKVGLKKEAVLKDHYHKKMPELVMSKFY